MTGKPNFPLITIMGPTASGKTPVATHLAYLLHGVVISGDSRQLYRGMDIGTGKDLADYNVGNEQIPYKLIDICNPGERYNIHAYQQRCMQELQQLEAIPCILCGGSGLYIEAVLGQYGLAEVPEDKTLREKLLDQPLELLHQQLQQYPQHYWPRDLLNKRRVIRALEIASYYTQHPEATNRISRTQWDNNNPIYIIEVSREVRRQRITDRLKARLEEGLVQEVQQLLQQGITPQDLIYYGLEYKFVTLYVMGELSYQQMFCQLQTAIHQFAKRQMTWIRGMERRGFSLTYVTPEETPALTALKLLADLRQRGYPLQQIPNLRTSFNT